MELVLTRHVATVAAIAALLGPVSLAQAQSDSERQEMLRGGATKKGIYNIFGLDGTDLGRTTVRYESKYAPGTIVVDTAERRLYLIQANGSALRYGIGVGRAGFQWKGTHKITAKKEKPDWTRAGGDDRAAKGCAEAHEGRRSGQSARHTRDVPWQHALPDPRLARCGLGR